MLKHDNENVKGQVTLKENSKKIFNILFFVTALVLLQQAIVQGNNNVDVFKAQTTLITEKNIDPAALFYTESELALKAEKEVRNRIAQ
jgi:hypothetical protein